MTEKALVKRIGARETCRMCVCVSLEVLGFDMSKPTVDRSNGDMIEVVLVHTVYVPRKRKMKTA